MPEYAEALADVRKQTEGALDDEVNEWIAQGRSLLRRIDERSKELDGDLKRVTDTRTRVTDALSQLRDGEQL